MKRSVPAILAGVLILSLMFGTGPVAAALEERSSPPGIDVVQPKTVRIGTFFSGSQVTVRGVVPAGAQAALRLVGPRQPLVLMKKGRVCGLWMNVGQVTFRGIPKTYLLWTSAPLSALGTEAERRLWKMDYPALLAGALPSGRPEETDLLLQELVKLKEEDRLYQCFEGAVKRKPLESREWEQVDAVLNLPAKIEPGSYSLELIAFPEGRGRLIHSSNLEVVQVGLPALIYGLAIHQGLWYGILAVLIATISGLLIGIVFSSKGGH